MDMDRITWGIGATISGVLGVILLWTGFAHDRWTDGVLGAIFIVCFFSHMFILPSKAINKKINEMNKKINDLNKKVDELYELYNKNDKK